MNNKSSPKRSWESSYVLCGNIGSLGPTKIKERDSATGRVEALSSFREVVCLTSARVKATLAEGPSLMLNLVFNASKQEAYVRLSIDD